MRQFAIVVLAYACFGDSCAAEITLTRVADTGTAIPDGDGNFTNLNWPVVDNGILIFEGRGIDNQRGLFRFSDGRLETVIDQMTSVPDSTALFHDARWPTMDGSTTAFMGRTTDGGSGIYTVTDGEVTRIADTAMPLTDSTSVFTSFGSPVIGYGQLAFSADTDSGTGIYAYEGAALRTIADTNTPIPGEGEVTFDQIFDRVQINDGQVLFAGANSRVVSGIYLERDGRLSSVIDTHDADLNTIANFSTDDGSVVFRGIDAAGKHAIYRDEIATDSRPQLIADAEMFAATLEDDFTFGRDYPLADGGNSVFVARTVEGTSGIFLLRDGELTPVVRIGDVLDGQQIDGIDGFDGHELGGGQFGFIVSYPGTGIDKAIYLATVPEPSCVSLLLFGLVLLHQLRRGVCERHSGMRFFVGDLE